MVARLGLVGTFTVANEGSDRRGGSSRSVSLAASPVLLDKNIYDGWGQFLDPHPPNFRLSTYKRVREHMPVQKFRGAAAQAVRRERASFIFMSAQRHQKKAFWCGRRASLVVSPVITTIPVLP